MALDDQGRDALWDVDTGIAEIARNAIVKDDVVGIVDAQRNARNWRSDKALASSQPYE